MIRQAHKYLVGAMSGATLIAVAIVAFVLLVSAQVFHNWPISAFGDGDSGSVSGAKTVSESGSGGGSAVANPAVASAGGRASAPAAGHGAGGAALAGPDSLSAGDPGASAPPTGGSHPSAGSTEGEAPSQSPSSEGGAGSTGSANGSGGGSSGSGGGSTESGSGAGTTASTPTGKVTGAVNETVHQVDETALGGTLEKTGVTGVTEEVVNGVVGPESTAGHAVDETLEAVGGLLGGKH